MIFTDLILFKKGPKRGVIIARDPRGCDVARKATCKSHASLRERLRGAELVRTRGWATRVHADARVVPCGKTVFGLAGDGPTG